MPSDRNAGRRGRRARWAAATVAGAITIAWAAHPAAGDQVAAPAGFTNGTASATTRTVRINPSAGSLSLGLIFGTSLAGYTNAVAKAESRGIDLGVIGTTLGARKCDGSNPDVPYEDQPQPLRVDSRDPDAGKAKTGSDGFFGVPIPGIVKTARATPAPLGDARTDTGDLRVPGVLDVEGGTSRAVTQVVAKATREAVATADVPVVSLAGGLVRLEGMRWEATHRTGARAGVTGTFRVQRLVVGGQAVPLGDDPAAGFAVANERLAPLGIVLRPPTVTRSADVVKVDPLVVAVVPEPDRDALVRPLVEAAQPVREPVLDAVLEAYCKAGSYVTVADVLVGSLTGGGEFTVELGGANASSAALRATSFLRPGEVLGDVVDDVLPDAPSGGVALGPTAALQPSVDAPAAVVTPGGAAPRTIVPAANLTRPGRMRLAVVGGVVLALLLAAAVADRRRMRRTALPTPTPEA